MRKLKQQAVAAAVNRFLTAAGFPVVGTPSYVNIATAILRYRGLAMRCVYKNSAGALIASFAKEQGITKGKFRKKKAPCRPAADITPTFNGKTPTRPKWLSPEYIKYIESAEWKVLRLTIFAQRGAKCEECGSVKDLHLHHLTYKNLGHEQPEDVKILCQSCHEKAHGRKFAA